MATLLAKGITFKSLIKQLSKGEFLTFMGKIFDMNHSDFISTSLFNYFINPPSITSPNTDDLNNINTILSTIIQARKTKPKSLSTTNIKLNQFPKALIGHIASFLKQNEYFQFEKINTSVFIACNAPNMLIELNLYNIKNYSSIKLSQFKSLKQLKINLSKFNEFPLPQNGQFILNQLEKLYLYGNRMKDFDIEPFMKQNCININNIKTLHFIGFGGFGGSGGRNKFNKDKFWRLLINFKNIEYLELYNIGTSVIEREQLEKLYDLYPKLKGVGVVAGDVSIDNNLINIFGNNLQFLVHYYPPRDEIDFSNINFSKLQQVVLMTPSIKTINQILKSAQNIRKFFLYPHGYNTTSPSPQELKIIIPQIFKCKLLEYFQIKVNNETYISVLDGIEAGLYETKKYERKQMKIRVDGKYNSQINLKDMMLNIKIARIIHWLQLKVNDFMFICDMRYINNTYKQELDSNDILNELNDISSNIKVNVGSNGLFFVIANTECRLCGWQESWLSDHNINRYD